MTMELGTDINRSVYHFSSMSIARMNCPTTVLGEYSYPEKRTWNNLNPEKLEMTKSSH